MPKARMLPAYRTRLGRAYHGDALTVLRSLPDASVALVFTSPPFALRRQKAYGNVAASEYIDWFWPIAQEIHRVLQDDGSFVMELGGAWNPRQGTRSLFPYELLLKLGLVSAWNALTQLSSSERGQERRASGICRSLGFSEEKSKIRAGFAFPTRNSPDASASPELPPPSAPPWATRSTSRPTP